MWRQLLTASNAALRVGTGFFAVALAIMTKALLTLLLTLSVSGSSFAAGAKPAWRVEWDKTVAAGGKGAALGTLYVGKLLDPIKPLLLLPEVLDETKSAANINMSIGATNISLLTLATPVPTMITPPPGGQVVQRNFRQDG